ncbi:MAG: class I tRNA ligase family protein, partial [Desulfuromonadaceae bacterium]
MTKETFYLTTAIHYANAAPHIGHAYEDVLADIIARYKRDSGLDVWFLTGMDEHGSKILRKAKEEGTGPQAFVDGNMALFKDLFDRLSVSYDDFIRTSDKDRHWPGTIALWKALDAKGD